VCLDFATQLNKDVNVNKILQLMGTAGLDRTCLFALADLIMRPLIMLGKRSEDILAFIAQIPNDNHREILSSSLDRLGGMDANEDDNRVREEITALRRQIQVKDEQMEELQRRYGDLEREG
jgi:predicted MPP superfamily phosphohydrolase